MGGYKGSAEDKSVNVWTVGSLWGRGGQRRVSLPGWQPRQEAEIQFLEKKAEVHVLIHSIIND